jgi:hypothetical protein
MYHSKRIGGDRSTSTSRRCAPAKRPADAGIRTAPRHRAPGNHHPVPADRAAGRSLHRRLRGAGALGPSEARPDVAVGIHRDRRRDRPDHRSRHVRDGPDCAPARDLAARDALARTDLRQRQRLLRQLLRHDLLHDIRTVLSRSSRRARHAEARTHRIAGDGKSGTCSADAAPDPRTRYGPVARRFRHRPFVAVLSAALPVRHA